MAKTTTLRFRDPITGKSVKVEVANSQVRNTKARIEALHALAETGTPARGRVPSGDRKPVERSAVRAWAIENGYPEVAGKRGRLAQEVHDAYNAEHASA